MRQATVRWIGAAALTATVLLIILSGPCRQHTVAMWDRTTGANSTAVTGAIGAAGGSVSGGHNWRGSGNVSGVSPDGGSIGGAGATDLTRLGSARAGSAGIAPEQRAAGFEELLQNPAFRGVWESRPGYAMLDGSVPPRLLPDAPLRVRFGVILVRYRGAEGASSKTRSKLHALELALSLKQMAETDFDKALAMGDDGSMESAGWMTRSILEPAVEYVVFSTPKGQVGGPVDSPRGFWIVKVHAIRKALRRSPSESSEPVERSGLVQP